MPDMLVPLYRLKPVDPQIDRLQGEGIIIRRANPWEISPTRDFIAQEFSTAWADETSVGFASKPVSVFLALAKGTIVGFAAYECTRRNFFGPTGVAQKMRGKGIGTALLLAALHGLREMGYAYAIIGGAGPTEFYQRTCGAIVIAESVPGIYVDMLKKQPTRTAKRRRY